jgi:hypothetical protein
VEKVTHTAKSPLSMADRIVHLRYAADHGGRVVHTAWLAAMALQERVVAPERREWGKLDKLDQKLDAHIAFEAMNGWLVDLDALCDRLTAKRLITFPLTQPAYLAPSYVVPFEPQGLDVMLGAYCRVEGARRVHAAWREGMVAQDRYVKPEYRHFDELEDRERALFAHISVVVIADYYAWATAMTMLMDKGEPEVTGG